jgi:Tfp pilus assembly protein PilF
MNAICRFLATSALLLAMAGCAQQPQGLSDVMERPAERALLNGLRAYEDGQYGDAERELQRALAAGLVSAKDRANAQKHLAFVYCTSNRMADCDRAFREALAADPEFALTRAEAGHPLWGPVYRRVTAGR